ncbi:MAG TPA: acetyl-CoA hydrolase/transferase C-terminal domain-containing protein [Saprospiraceae bacterium]|nr:acetyl-CoA hydrolase/transferase family protein [Lewinellaceae bacterium]HPK08879.1 acetyl-CoA hydrolase/transferase C-terminal domain-containing protein [Saprospiraceae bacterium]HRX29774.1 acetyl-CoA hydrolase/transferase C-terminal domain-containing protein [Saprospiraceae bacterium]
MNNPLKYISLEEAISHIKSGDRVFLQGSAQTPASLLREMARQSDRLKNVDVISISLQGEVEIAKEEYKDSFHINSLFVSEPVRKAVNGGWADFVPIFLSDIPHWFRRGKIPIDVAIIQVSPPDKHGYCSMGASVDIGRTATRVAKMIIAQVNPNVPRTHGDGIIHSSRFHHVVYLEEPLAEINYGGKVSAEDLRIGEIIAEMIEDGSTLQMGIGTIPDAVLRCLGNHKNLGLHTEMFSDGLLPLFENDVINNTKKKIHQNIGIVGFALGSRALYDYIDDNPAFNFLDMDYVNDPAIIKLNPKMVAINSAIEVDLTGQVCADSIGYYQYSGIGGQMDYIRGAALSEGGKPIIAINSRTRKGLPRIVPHLHEGAGVVTTRGHVHYVVTEYGAVNLAGMNLRDRSRLLISIAHPDDREMLARAAYERFNGNFSL